MAAEHVVLGVYVACLLAVLTYSLSVSHLALIVRRDRATGSRHLEAVVPVMPHAARVTVQLPIYNELHVARRVIDAACALTYPRDLLRIQVLDDSTDGTRSIVDTAVADHRARGVDIVTVRRSHRDGYKAGALAHGLTRDDADFVLVLDADFVPGTDLVERLLEGFRDGSVGAVQARWGYLNEDESLTTAVQAFCLGLHFRVEQPGRSVSGGMLNFNGTAGMWRREAIDAGGGWLARTVTEDIDLSYRAQLGGWRIVYLDDVVVPSELPADMSALRGQQHRWIKGGAQNARLHLRAVWHHAAPLHVRWHAAMHLVSGSLYAVILTMLAVSVPLAALKNTAITTDTSTGAFRSLRRHWHSAERSSWPTSRRAGVAGRGSPPCFPRSWSSRWGLLCTTGSRRSAASSVHRAASSSVPPRPAARPGLARHTAAGRSTVGSCVRCCSLGGS